MRIELLKNPDKLRKRFIDRFCEDREHFRLAHTDFVKQLDDFDQWYDQSYMWDRFPCDIPDVTISKALELLNSHNGDVLFMSECEGFHATCDLPINGERIEGFVAKADAKELADPIAKLVFIVRFGKVVAMKADTADGLPRLLETNGIGLGRGQHRTNDITAIVHTRMRRPSGRWAYLGVSCILI